MQGRDAHLYKSTADCFVKLFREEGVVSFYRGVVPRSEYIAYVYMMYVDV